MANKKCTKSYWIANKFMKGCCCYWVNYLLPLELVFSSFLFFLLAKPPVTFPFTWVTELCQLMSWLRRLYSYTSERKVSGWAGRAAPCLSSTSVLDIGLLEWQPRRCWYGTLHGVTACFDMLMHRESHIPEALLVLEGRAAAWVRKGMI